MSESSQVPSLMGSLQSTFSFCLDDGSEDVTVVTTPPEAEVSALWTAALLRPIICLTTETGGSSVDPVVAESVRGDDDHGGGGDEEALELEAAIASITEFEEKDPLSDEVSVEMKLEPVGPKVEMVTPSDMNPELFHGEVVAAGIQMGKEETQNYEDSNRGCEEEYEILFDGMVDVAIGHPAMSEEEALSDELLVEMKLEPVIPKVKIATPPDMNLELSYGEVFDACIQIEDSNRGCEEEYEILREPMFEEEALSDELSVEMKLEPVIPKVEIATPPDMNLELSYGEVFDTCIQIEDSNRTREEYGLFGIVFDDAASVAIKREHVEEALPDELSVAAKKIKLDMDPVTPKVEMATPGDGKPKLSYGQRLLYVDGEFPNEGHEDVAADWPSPPTKEDMIRDGLIEEDAAGMRCTLCGYEGGWRGFTRIQRHMEGKHSVGPGYPCPMCAYVAKTKDDCQTHGRLKHHATFSYRKAARSKSPIQAGKRLGLVCGACGGKGHMKTNKACPKFEGNE